MARKKKAKAAATPTKKNGRKTGWKRCATDGCRKRTKEGSTLCPQCYDNAFPNETVEQLTTLEALQFSALDTEIRNQIQGVRIIDLEMVQEQQKFAAVQKERNNRREQLLATVAAKKAEYTVFIQELATKYDMDPEHMTIDPDSRAIRDLRSEVGTTTNT